MIDFIDRWCSLLDSVLALPGCLLASMREVRSWEESEL